MSSSLPNCSSPGPGLSLIHLSTSPHILPTVSPVGTAHQRGSESVQGSVPPWMLQMPGSTITPFSVHSRPPVLAVLPVLPSRIYPSDGRLSVLLSWISSPAQDLKWFPVTFAFKGFAVLNKSLPELALTASGFISIVLCFSLIKFIAYVYFKAHLSIFSK